MSPACCSIDLCPARAPVEGARPLVSVGITTYKRPDFLKSALDCILNQTYRNLEIIISDDCSPCEKTKALLKKYAASDSRIRWFSQPVNLGPPANFCFTLSQATGDFFFWADDDDLRDESWVETLLIKLRSENAMVAFSNLNVIDLNGEILRPFSPFRFDAGKTNRLIRYFLAESAEGKANLVCGLYRTNFVRSVKHWGSYKRNLLATDELFVLDCVQHSRIVEDRSTTLYKRIGGTSTPQIRSVSDFLQRCGKEIHQQYACIAIVRGSFYKILLLMLTPVKLLKQLMYRCAP